MNGECARDVFKRESSFFESDFYIIDEFSEQEKTAGLICQHIMVNRLSRMIIGAPSVDRGRLSGRQLAIQWLRPKKRIGQKAPDFKQVVVSNQRSGNRTPVCLSERALTEESGLGDDSVFDENDETCGSLHQCSLLHSYSIQTVHMKQRTSVVSKSSRQPQ